MRIDDIKRRFFVSGDEVRTAPTPDDVEWMIYQITTLRGLLREKEWTACDDSCEDEEHPYTEENDEHHRSCMWCGAMQCEGHKPNCRLAAALKEEG